MRSRGEGREEKGKEGRCDALHRDREKEILHIKLTT